MAASLFDFPQKIQIQTHNRCNFACRMCPYPTTNKLQDRHRMDENLFRRIVDETQEAGRKVKLCLMLQNEPLLDKRFKDFVEYAHSATDGIASISTVTNGSVLTEELLDHLVSYARFHLTVSLNATDAERYRGVHGRDAWHRIHSLLAAWGGPRERIRVSFVLDRGSVAQGKNFRQYWESQGYRVRFLPQNSRANSLVNQADNVAFVDGSFGHCHYPVDTLNVLADGSVILCCNDWKHSQRFGNLCSSSIAEAWNSSPLRALRTAAIRGSLRKVSGMCKNCDYPMRSVHRMELETLLSDTQDGQLGKAGPEVVMHGTSIRRGDNEELCPIRVWHVDGDAGVIVALVAEPIHTLPSSVLFEFQICHDGVFSFGSLERVWCPAKLKALDALEVLPGVAAVAIELDRQAPEYQLLPWYVADWRLPTEDQFAPQQTRGGE